MGPQNSLVGDSFGIDLPEMEIDPTTLNDEKKMAKFSRTSEFKRLKQYLDGRITHYQTHLPNGLEVGLDVVPSTEDWRVANRVIGEMKAIINMYESVQEVVDDISRKG